MKYNIPVSKIEKLEKIINRANKKGGHILYTLGDEVICDGYLTVENKMMFPVQTETHPIKVKCREVFVEGVYQVNGWAFVGTIEFKELGNIIRLADSSFEGKIPAKYYHTDTICEHCGTKRHRKDTYLIYNAETNEFKQVGSNCLLDYTQGLDADECASIMSCLNAFITYSDYGCNEDGFFGNGFNETNYGVSTQNIKKYAIALVKAFGYKRSENGEGTARDLSKFYFRLGDWKERFGSLQLASDEEVKELDAYAQKIYDDIVAQMERCMKTGEFFSANEYMRNASIAWLSNYAETRDFGLITSFVNTYLRETKKVVEKSSSQYQGNVGDRITIEIVKARVLFTKDPYTYYGDYTFVNELIDRNGNIYIWSTNEAIDRLLTGNIIHEDVVKYCEKENFVTIKATVKEHKEFRGIKQTVITRGKVLSQHITNKMCDDEETSTHPASVDIDNFINSLLND